MSNQNDTFETGASTAQANNLVLSVMNDGTVYSERLHCAFAALQGSSHRLTIKDLVKSEANKQRKMGSTFKASAITEAAKIVLKQSITHALENIVSEWNGEYITVTRRGWWDATCGNTYFSCCVSIPTENGMRWLSIPMQYGYGEQWQFESVDVLKRAGFDFQDVSRRELPINFNDTGDGLKRNMYTGVFI